MTQDSSLVCYEVSDFASPMDGRRGQGRSHYCKPNHNRHSVETQRAHFTFLCNQRSAEPLRSLDIITEHTTAIVAECFHDVRVVEGASISPHDTNDPTHTAFPNGNATRLRLSATGVATASDSDVGSTTKLL